MSGLPDNGAAPAASWLLRVPEVFADEAEAVWRHLRVLRPVTVGRGWYSVKLPDAARVRTGAGALGVAWRLPLEHAWPCAPRGMDGFIEKAAQALVRKFGPRQPQAVLMGPLDTGARDPFFKGLASNLRGRALQLFGALPVADAESQDPGRETLFCLVGPTGLFAGMSTPRAANGFHPGGVKFIRQEVGVTISRAGSKIAEALHWLRLHREVPGAGSHWLELGASPGGMTAELLRRHCRVTAVDRAPLDPRLKGSTGLRFHLADSRTWRTPAGSRFDAVLCDMNGAAEESLAAVLRQVPHLRMGGLVIFTVKTAGVPGLAEAAVLVERLHEEAALADLRPVAVTHLAHNRREFTAVWERA